VFDETGRFRGYRGIARDITNAKAAEDAVRESEQRFRLLAESTRDVIWISDPAISRIDYVTPAVQDVWGIPAAKLMSRPSTWMELVHSEDVDIAQAALQNQIRGQPIDVEFRIVRPEGELRWLWVRSTPTRDSRGEAIVCGITEDITRRKLEQLQKLEEAVRQRDALVREVHHRIKNSLQGVAGLLRSHAHRNRLAAASLETAISQIQAIATVHGLQAMGRSGGVDIARVAEAIARMLENLTQTAIRLEGFEASGRRFILAEGEAVATALLLNELIVNAVKHRPAGDTTSDVCVSLRAGSPSVEIQVCNRGALPTAFDLSRRTGLGTGLELVCALLPKRGLVLSIGAGSGWVSSSLILSAPVIQPTEPTMGERLS
jgi:PAS domain S-box-containing protein